MSHLSRRTDYPWCRSPASSVPPMDEQGLRDSRAFLRVEACDGGLSRGESRRFGRTGFVLYPSPPHVPFSSTPKQRRFAMNCRQFLAALACACIARLRLAARADFSLPGDRASS